MILKDAVYLKSDALFLHQQKAWEKQREYVSRHSDFYKTLWGDKRPPKDLRDLAQLPLSDKAQLRLSQEQFPPFGSYLASAREDVNRIHRTSGTTGQAMNLALSARDCEITEIVGGRCQSAAGLGPQHTVVHCLNYQMWMGGLSDHMTLERTGASVVPFGVGGTELLIRTIQELGITAISCTPSYPAVLERVLQERFEGVKPIDLGLKLGLFGGEAGLDDPLLRKNLRETWGMEPRNANYGVSDVFCNFAAQCEHDTRLHFLAGDVLYPELIDQDTLQPVSIKAGAEGELVLTHLVRDCQPLVRFRSGDIIAVDETDPCQCGRGGMRFRVIGRSDDMVVIRGLNLFPTMVAGVINELPELSGNYRIVLDTPPPYDFLPIEVEMTKGEVADDDVGRRVEVAVKAKLGATAQVRVMAAESFPITEGKTIRVIRTYQ